MQTSLEFLLILGALSALSLSVISLYGKTVFSQSSQISNSLSAVASHTNISYSNMLNQQTDAYLSMPVNSILGQGSDLQIVVSGCSSGTAEINVKSQSLFFAEKNATVEIKGIGVESLQFTPEMPGINEATVSLNITCGNYTMSKSYSLSTFSTSKSSAYNVTGLSALLAASNQSILYDSNPPENVITLSSQTHCTLVNFYYRPLGIAAQCGTANAWEYETSDMNCINTAYGSYTQTTCIYPHDTSYSLISPDAQEPHYLFNVSLLVGMPLGEIRSNLSSAKTEAPALLNGVPVGTAKISSVSSENQASGLVVLVNVSTYNSVSASVYDEYTRAVGNLYSTLGYYNTTLQYSTQIAQAIYSYNTAYGLLVNSSTGGINGSCNVTLSGFTCKPAQLSYVINLYLYGNFSKSSGIQNQTLEYQTSEINLVT